MSALEIILTLCISVIAFNSIIYACLWKINKHNLFKNGFIIWSLMFVNFGLQGFFKDLDIFTLVSYSTYFLISISFVKFFSSVMEKEINNKKYFIMYGIAFIATGICEFLNLDFLWKAIPFSLAISYPLIETSLKTIFNKNKKFIDLKMLAGVLLLQGLHFLDYPFLRPQESTALFGFSFAFFLMFSLSVMIPLVIVKFTLGENNKKLEKEISKRRLSEENLVKTVKELNESNKVKDQFLSNMSHEMKTPLNIILGITQILERNTDKKVVELSNTIDNNGKRLNKIVSNVIEFHSLNKKSVKENKEKVSLQEINKKLNKIIKDSKKENIIANFYEENCSTNIDIEKVQKVFSLLLDNAIKFGQDEIITISSKINASNFEISIQDKGQGIPEDKIKTIFESFNQADNSNTRRQGGIGLGLSLVKKYLDIIHGKINVSSEEGKGSLFSLSIPAEIIKNKEIQSILIVDDEEECRNTLADYIKIVFDDKFTIDLAKNGQEAFDKSKEKNYDLIFMDLQMPVMDGLQSTKLIRTLDYDPEIIMLTGAGSDIPEVIESKKYINMLMHKPADYEFIEEKLSA